MRGLQSEGDCLLEVWERRLFADPVLLLLLKMCMNQGRGTQHAYEFTRLC
jgi:hypothetical protein